MKILALLVSLAVARVAYADATDDVLARARDLQHRGEFAQARDALLDGYQRDPRPALLFALGQMEFNLAQYAAAIDYYERFMATNPPPDQAALAEQAIGAARIKLDQDNQARLHPPPAPPTPVVVSPRPPPHREWDINAWGLTALGGLAVVVGGGLLVASHDLDENHGGTLRQYDQRFDQARTERLAGILCGSAGVLAIAAAVVRWRFHLVETTVEVHATATGAGVTLERRL